MDFRGMRRALLLNLTENANATQKRVGEAFRCFVLMLWAMFALGIASFAISVVMGFRADDTAHALAAMGFGGMSVATFVSIFVKRSSDRMELAGPRAAWLQSMINSYWLSVADDDHICDADIERAQRLFDETMQRYLNSGLITTTAAPDPPDNGASGTGTGAVVSSVA